MATSSEDVINIDDLLASTQKELEKLLPFTDDCCISKAPERVRRFNEHLYTPKLISIGPIHHGKQELRAMEEYKKRYLKDFLQLGQASLKQCFELVKTNETKLRNCYAEPIELQSYDFVKMVLVDGVFLVMTFLCECFVFHGLSMGRERMFKKPIMIREVIYDLVLLENQIPFFIIQQLYKLSNIHNKRNISSVNVPDIYSETGTIRLHEETAMLRLAIQTLRRLHIIEIPTRQVPTHVEHLLDLLRSCLKPIEWNPDRKPLTVLATSMPSLTELNQVGVKIKTLGNRNLFNMKFKNGVLELCSLAVHSGTELVFRNLVALERCNNLDFLCIDYFRMMQKLLVAPGDAEVLIKHKIIGNGLPDAQAISTLFHNLSSGNFIASNFGYSDVVRDLTAYRNVRWNRWKANWIQKYFKAPWAIFSFTAAVILLILTIIQTVCSILQVT